MTKRIILLIIAASQISLISCYETKKESVKNQTKSSDWALVLRREDGSVDFNRDWDDYVNGFGDPNGEYFIGLEELHTLTTTGPPKELRIILKDFENHTRYAIYDKFVIGDEDENYAIKEIGKYHGNAGNSLSYHLNQEFTAIDSDNSLCAERFQGGWWYEANTVLDNCYRSNLMGPYLRGINDIGGTVWGSFNGWNYSLKFVEVLLRPKTQRTLESMCADMKR